LIPDEVGEEGVSDQDLRPSIALDACILDLGVVEVDVDLDARGLEVYNRSEHSKEARKREVQHRARVFFDASVVHDAGYWSIVGSVGCLEHRVLPGRLCGAEGANEHNERDGETGRRRDRQAGARACYGQIGESNVVVRVGPALSNLP